MKSLIAAALFLCSDATLEETSLMQGLVSRQNKLTKDVKGSRQDATAKLMETATKMMKNGATPDVVTFIETTITEVNRDVLGVIVEEHHRDQQLIWDLLTRFDTAIAEMAACAASVEQQHADRAASSIAHQTCRSAESIDCARSRRCEEELEELWSIVKIEEEEMRRIHWEIHGEWCEGPAPPHPGLADPFQWTLGESWEGPETSQSTDPYPAIDLAPAVIEFRRFSVEYFGLYILQKPRVEMAWENYNRKLLECAALEETWTLKVDDCDDLQDVMHNQACMHSASNRQCASNFGHEYHMTMVAYQNAVTTIRQLEYDRKREWETLHIVTCLLETVYTHVIHSIDSGEPCPTTESHPEQTVAEINTCHIVEESMTTNLTIDYGTPPPPPELPPVLEPPCTAQYIWDEHGAFSFEIQASHSQTITDEGLGNYFTVLSAFGWAGCAAPKACVPCETAEILVDPSYESNSVCKQHQQHLRPGQMDWDSFKCLSGDQCIQASGRCNDVFNCDDESDELGCETQWGAPAVLQSEECHEVFFSDVQFRCADNTCTHVAGRCNGINNCPDGSDEQGCATTTTGLTLESTTGFTATIETPAINSAVFYDRTYTFDSLGSFTGHSFIKMNNEDKHIRHSHVQMKLRLPQPLTIYVAKLDDHELPWLQADGWSRSGLEGVSYHGVRQTRHTDWSGELNEDHYGPGQVFQKTFAAGTVELRGNNGGDGSYVMFVANPANAPQAPVDTVFWTQHLGDYMKCNSNVDMEYVADQHACQQLALANGHHFYSFRHNGEGGGHKCMSSASCDNALGERTNEWKIYTSVNNIPSGADPAMCPGVDASGEWTLTVGGSSAAQGANSDVGATCFNELFKACPVVRYTNPIHGGTGSGVYVRHGARYAGNAHDLFTNFWVQNGNQHKTDFEIYTTIEDARSGSNAWTYCNFADQPNPHHVGVGFPRDCGPTGYQPAIWYSGHQGYFEAYTGASCPLPEVCPGVNTNAEWTTAVGSSGSAVGGVNVGQACFNALFRACPVVRYTNPNNGGTGTGVYMRHGSPYAGDAYDLFTRFWVRAGNDFQTDFNIYPTIEDARSGTSAWTYCNFADDPNPVHDHVGFPRDCGPTGYQPHIWYPSGGQGHFELYSGDDCPVHSD